MKNIKLNWGQSIALFYTCFVIAMLSMVFMSTQNKAQLVQENYYSRDLNYEDHRSSRENAKNLALPIKVISDGNEQKILLSFPTEMKAAKGDVLLFRPSNKYLDKSFSLTLDESAQMEIPLNKQTPDGLWKIKLNWNIEGENYYMEENIIL